ncbi:thrombospondin type 3 repeat-containing protein [Tenacibaculum amylolyticum]|uniref:thrombospondin type 3 repeat-containing protein n=1 Tax=Tenacibaculum amylolyticum TaxID=104269 RepID=UPI0038939A37
MKKYYFAFICMLFSFVSNSQSIEIFDRNTDSNGCLTSYKIRVDITNYNTDNSLYLIVSDNPHIPLDFTNGIATVNISNVTSNVGITLIENQVLLILFPMIIPTPIGVLTEYKCPNDYDQDGVINSQDECPNEAGNTSSGCPDSDGDGTLDKDDECPSIPGSLSAFGCPDSDGDTIPDHRDVCPHDPINNCFSTITPDPNDPDKIKVLQPHESRSASTTYIFSLYDINGNLLLKRTIASEEEERLIKSSLKKGQIYIVKTSNNKPSYKFTR